MYAGLVLQNITGLFVRLPQNIANYLNIVIVVTCAGETLDADRAFVTVVSQRGAYPALAGLPGEQ